MKRLTLFLSLMGLMLLPGGYGRAEEVSASAAADVENVAAYEPKIIVSDQEKIIIEITMPALTVKPSNTPEARGQLIMMSGYSQTAKPGAPQLPLQGFSVAIPENAKPTIQILEQEVETRNLGDIPPAPRIQYDRSDGSKPEEPRARYLYERDATIYSKNEFYPGAQVQLGTDGIMRDLRMLNFQVHPVLFNPVQNRVKFTKRLRFAIYYNGSVSGANWSEQNSSKSFEDIFKSSLLNYEVSKKFRINRRSLQKTGADDYFLSQGSEWYKLLLKKPGIYYVTRADLEAAGMNLSGVDPHKFRMFNKGVEIAINVTGEEDGSFDTADVIEFYGTAFKNYYTTTNMYWLTVGTTDGKRMIVKDGSVTGSFPTLIRGKETYHYEIDQVRKANYPGHTDNERWFTSTFTAPRSRTYSMTLNNISAVAPTDFNFYFKGQGGSDVNAVDPDHHTIVELNGNQIINEYWDGQVSFKKNVPILQTHLINGQNQVIINEPGDTGASPDLLYFDYFEIEYWRDYIANQDTIEFTAEGNGDYIIELIGFAQSNRKLYDISDSTNVTIFSSFDQNEDSLRFSVNLVSKKRFLSLAEGKRRKPLSLIKDQFSSLRSTSNKADYIIITFDEYFNSCSRLADFRESQGLDVKIVKAQDIYDEFNYGIYEEKPIRWFLNYTYTNWAKPAPTYILLVGDASYNPRILNPSAYGGDRSDFVPTRLFESIEDHFEAVSDNYFVNFDETDVLPDMLIGRLPARNSVFVDVMVDKIVNYETDFKAGLWNNTATFVADIGETGVLAFEDSSNAFIRDLVPNYFTVKRAYRSELGTSGTKQAIMSAIDNGTLIVNYYGHGSVASWTSVRVLDKSDIPNLRNDNDAPFVLTLSCINGYFVEPIDADLSLAEAFLRERQRGAVSVFSGSGEAYPSPVLAMGRDIYRTLFKEHTVETGAFTYAGLAKMYSRYPDLWDHVMFYTLFGDPATKLHYQPSQTVVTAGYQGTMALRQGDAPAGTELLATIQNRVMASDVARDKGAFGPLSIIADDPSTPMKEGGAAGDSVLFKTVAGKDTLLLTPRYAWKAGEVQTVKLRLLSTDVSQAAVDINIYADAKKFGEELLDGDFIAKSSVLSATLTPLQGVVDLSALSIALNGEALTVDQYSVVTELKEGKSQVRISYLPAALADGDYTLTVAAGSSAAAEKQVRFVLQSTLNLANVVNFPNPIKDATSFTYILENDRPAEVEIKIYTVAGRLIQVISAASGQVGFNETAWDGLDAEGDELANGVYFYKVSADDGEEKTEVIERLVVMR